MSDLKKKLKAIHRRDFLRGAAAVAIGLPLLEYMLEGKAEAAIVPKRFIIMFNGIALGNTDGSHYTPTGTGLNWTPNVAHKDIVNYPMLKPYVTIVKNLAINHRGDPPVNNGPGADQESGHHEFGWKLQLTGDASYNVNQQYDASGHDVWSGRIFGTTADRALKNNLGLGNQFEHINYCVQPRYGGSGGDTMQADASVSYNATTDPFIAYNAMISRATPTTAATTAERVRQLTQQKSVLDLLETNRVAYLAKLLGAADKQKLSDHFDMIRDIERSVSADLTAAQTTTGTPQPLPTCHAAPAPAGDITIHDHGIYTFQPTNLNENWSNETLRSKIFRDIAVMGLSCDKSRLGTIILTQSHSWINGLGLSKGLYASDYHEMSHGVPNVTGSQLGLWLSTCTAWHMNEMFQFAEALRSIPEGSGNMLDNTLIMLMSEGGFSPTHGSHTQLNQSVTIIGKAGLTPKGVIDAGQAHTCQAVLTAMNAVGYTGGKLGAVTQDLAVLK